MIRLHDFTHWAFHRETFFRLFYRDIFMWNGGKEKICRLCGRHEPVKIFTVGAL